MSGVGEKDVNKGCSSCFIDQSRNLITKDVEKWKIRVCSIMGNSKCACMCEWTCAQQYIQLYHGMCIGVISVQRSRQAPTGNKIYISRAAVDLCLLLWRTSTRWEGWRVVESWGERVMREKRINVNWSQSSDVCSENKCRWSNIQPDPVLEN